jgi:Leucine-rich repeat (LRR) protein
MDGCESREADRANEGIKENVFEFLRNPEKLKKLNISYCKQFTDYTFERFEKFINLRDLSMEGCDQQTITNKAFKHFDKITTLNMKYCDQNTIGDDAFTNLANIEMLNMNKCSQPTITSEAFKHLKSLQILYMVGCKQDTIGNKAFEYLGTISKIKTLYITHCNQRTISDNAFTHLSSLTELRMSYCKQDTITGESLTRDNLPKLKVLDIYQTNKTTQEYAEYNFGVTNKDEHVKPQVGRTRYARTAKLSVKSLPKRIERPQRHAFALPFVDQEAHHRAADARPAFARQSGNARHAITWQ